MSNIPKNSVAAALSILVLVVMWLTAIVGLLFLGGIALALIANTGSGLDTSALTIDTNIESLPALISGFFGGLVVISGIFYVCVQLRRILSTLANGDPFVPENAGRLTKIATAILVIQLLRYAIAIIVGASFDEAALTIRVDLMAWAAIAALFVLAQVFREGTRLREEEIMTI